jgi:class 3 adenylate cyclase
VESRPTGTVTFFFTDVAGSTRLWDSDRQGMATSLATHDRILKGAIADHGGYIFSTAGDSFGASFPTAAAALDAAVQAQLALDREAWSGPRIKVRMGLHTGSSQERAGNYFGPDVNRAARIMSAANGGQILVSGVTAQLVAGLGTSYSLVDRDVHALKDLDRPSSRRSPTCWRGRDW